MKKKYSISQKTVEQNIPYAIGGAAALAVNPIVDPILGSNAWVSGGAKALIGLLALGFGGKYATGFGVTMSAYGVGQLVNKGLQTAGMEPVAGLPSVTGIYGLNDGIYGVDPRYIGTHNIAGYGEELVKAV